MLSRLDGAAWEEFVFRGVMCFALAKSSGSVLLALVVSSAIFSAFHLNNMLWLPTRWRIFHLFCHFLAGVIFGCVFLVGGLYPAVVAHCSSNIIIARKREKRSCGGRGIPPARR